MARYQKTVPLNINADIVWGAVCQAQRLNQGYIKVSDAAPTGQSNRSIVMQFIADPTQITPEDMEQGKQVRKYFQGYTFKILKGIKLSEFDNDAMLLANRDTIDTMYEISLITCLPSGYERGIKRQTVDQRISFAKGGLVGRVSEKVSVSIEVLKSFYSQQWNTNYVTGITSDDQALFFAFKQPLEVGKMYDLYGTVKAHRDNVTQLNRVKVLSVV